MIDIYWFSVFLTVVIGAVILPVEYYFCNRNYTYRELAGLICVLFIPGLNFITLMGYIAYGGSKLSFWDRPVLPVRV